MEALKQGLQGIQGLPRTEMLKVKTKGQPNEESVNVILQVIPHKEVVNGLSAEDRKDLAKELLREILEVSYEEEAHGDELRFIGKSDNISKTMMEKEEEMPWKELQDFLPLLKEETLKDINAAGGLWVGMQQ